VLAQEFVNVIVGLDLTHINSFFCRYVKRGSIHHHIATMRQTHSQHIRACLARAAEAERLAAAETDKAAKAELLTLADNWRQMANGYEYVEKLEGFLKAHSPSKQSLRKH
jgi:hypothetical protein